MYSVETLLKIGNIPGAVQILGTPSYLLLSRNSVMTDQLGNPDVNHDWIHDKNIADICHRHTTNVDDQNNNSDPNPQFSSQPNSMSADSSTPSSSSSSPPSSLISQMSRTVLAVTETNRSVVFCALGKLDEARNILRNIVDTFPLFSPAIKTLVYVNIRMGDQAAAISILQKFCTQTKLQQQQQQQVN